MHLDDQLHEKNKQIESQQQHILDLQKKFDEIKINGSDVTIAYYHNVIKELKDDNLKAKERIQ